MLISLATPATLAVPWPAPGTRRHDANGEHGKSPGRQNWAHGVAYVRFRGRERWHAGHGVMRLASSTFPQGGAANPAKSPVGLALLTDQPK